MTSSRRQHRHRTTALIRYEWIKLRSLRSTWFIVGGLLVVTGIAGIDGVHAAFRANENAKADPVYGTVGITYAQYLALVLGVLSVTAEFGTGAIRGSLLVVPRRMSFYAAKAFVAGALAFAVASAYVIIDLVLEQLPGSEEHGWCGNGSAAPRSAGRALVLGPDHAPRGWRGHRSAFLSSRLDAAGRAVPGR